MYILKQLSHSQDYLGVPVAIKYTFTCITDILLNFLSLIRNPINLSWYQEKVSLQITVNGIIVIGRGKHLT